MHGLLVTWTETTQNVNVFKLYKSTDGTNFSLYQTLAGNIFQYLDTSGTGGATYYYYVTATVNGIEGPASNTVSGNFPNVPAAPVATIATQ